MLHFELHPVYIHAIIVFGQHTDSVLLRQDVKTAKEKKKDPLTSLKNAPSAA